MAVKYYGDLQEYLKHESEKEKGNLEITDKMKRKIKCVFEYVGTSTTDWTAVKKELVRLFSNDECKYVSTRHEFTKKHYLNSFDKIIIEYWQSLGGNKLEIPPEKQHDESWVFVGRVENAKRMAANRIAKQKLAKLNEQK